MANKHPLFSHDKNRIVRVVVLMYPNVHSEQYNKKGNQSGGKVYIFDKERKMRLCFGQKKIIKF